MPNYLPTHKKNFLNEFNVSKFEIQPGAIVKFTYVNEEKEITKPLVVVLNPLYKGNMHAIRIDEVMPDKVQKLVDTIKLWYSRKLEQKVHQRLPLVKVNVGSPRTFYENTLIHVLPRLLKTDDVYREYKLNRVSSLRLIEYRFNLQEQIDEKAAKKKEREKRLMDEAIKRVRSGRNIV